jgi:hypothetical protein
MDNVLVQGCPVCGYPDCSPFYESGASNFIDICDCCGCHSGVHYSSSDEPARFAYLRRLWISEGKQWWPNVVAQPPGWDADKQLKNVAMINRHMRSLGRRR